jgi:hypothetical protein
LKIFGVKLLFLCGLIVIGMPAAFADPAAKVMVLDFQLNDLTDLPNAPQELARIEYLSTSFQQGLRDKGVELVAVTEQIKVEMTANNATYLFDRTEHAAKLAQGSGADYLIIAVALKPTYLFVYPRILLVEVKSGKVLMPSYAQLESSWSDQNTTAHTAAFLANKVSVKLRELAAQAN